jgi:hypothetical protein
VRYVIYIYDVSRLRVNRAVTFFADVLHFVKLSSLRAVCTVGNTKEKEAGARLGESRDWLISNTPWIVRKRFIIMATRVGNCMA